MADQVEATSMMEGEVNGTEPSDRVTPDDARTELVRRFCKLAEDWRRETRFLSSTTRMAEHPAYQEIIRMGRPAVPLILEELQRQPDHWFVALTAITGENPIRPEDAGNLRRMTEAWLEFASEHGYR